MVTGLNPSESRTAGWLPAILLLPVAMIVSGCGGGDAAPEPSQASTPTDGTTDAGAEAAAPRVADTSTQHSTSTSPAGQERGQDEVWVDDEGNKYIGKVPYDVFFDRPYDVAANTTPLAGNATAATGSPNLPAMGSGSVPETATTEAPAATATADAGASDNWEDLIPLTVLESEIKDIRNFLTPTLQSVGNYNSSMLMIPPRAATVAVLAEIARTYPKGVSWKEDANYIRNLAKKMNESALQRGAKDQRRLLGLFEGMTDTFNRSRPASLEEPPAEDTFVDVAEMRLVMMRMADAERKMKTEAGSESAFAEKKEMIQHEAAILRTLTKVIAMEGYGYADDPDFTGYADAIVKASGEVVNASEAGDFASYELALSNISSTCQTCHSEYKNN
jgi:hypothetical protein